MGRLLGIDYGIRRIGLALSDLLGFTAQPLCIIERKSLAGDLQLIADLAKEQQVEKVILGLPLNMDGTEGILTDEVKDFGRRLGEKLQLPVELYDERLTTMQAERILVEEADISRDKRKKLRDKVAASLILQSYLDQNR